MSELASLLGRYPKLHIYADDAHSISWAGRHGRGAVLSALGEFDRVVVAMSLNKAFGAVGGALAFSSRELRDRVRRCGGPLIFSGPISPGGLGSAVASAKLHLSSQFAELQADLAERVAFARSAIGDTGIELATESDTPILMVHFDSVPAAQAAVRGMRERGFFVCLSTFPAVPVNKPSLRCTISRHNSFADIRELVDGLSEVTTRRPLLSGLTGEARASVEAS
jgi:7-keto-8-aminopelargonate synthetase-like enzyme